MRMQFTNQQLTNALMAVVAGFILLAVFLSTWTPPGLHPDPAYVMPADWPFSGLRPPRGSVPAISEAFLAIAPVQGGKELGTSEGGVDKSGIAFSHSADPERMEQYFGEILEEAGFTPADSSTAGRYAGDVLAVWNSEYGNFTVILLRGDGYYELLVHEVP